MAKMIDGAKIGKILAVVFIGAMVIEYIIVSGAREPLHILGIIGVSAMLTHMSLMMTDVLHTRLFAGEKKEASE